MNKRELTELVVERVTSIAFRDSLSMNAALENKFRTELGFNPLEINELNITLAHELSKCSDEQLITDDFDVFWLDFDPTVQELVNYIAEKLCVK